MDTSVVVLMSTYNGEKFLKEQLLSIFNQDFEGRIYVLIRDDGSSDKTIDIVKIFPQFSKGILQLDIGKNLGPQRSFLNLIKQVSNQYDYYFFSDQDDVWDNDKIKKAVDNLKAASTPAIYCSNYRLTDDVLNVMVPQAINTKPLFTPIRSLLYNEVPGCCMAFNKSLMDKLKEINIDNVMMHDSMALLIASYIGTVIYDEQPRISHRIHDSNVVGTGHKKVEPIKWIKEKWLLVKNGDDYDISEFAAEVLRVSSKDEKQEYKRDLELLRDFKNSLADTIRLLKHPETKGNPLDRTVMSIRSKILFHIF